MLTSIEHLHQTGEVTLRRLVKEALRMRPDRIVIGEVRGAEALDLLLALNTGVPGMASIHANSATDALSRLEALALLGAQNVDRSFVQGAVARSVGLVVHCALEDGGRRRVVEAIQPHDQIEDGAYAVTRPYAFVADAPPSVRS